MDQSIIDRFIRGKASPEEVRKVLRWYYSDEAEHEMAENIAHLWQAVENDGSSGQFEQSETLETIRQRIRNWQKIRRLPKHNLPIRKIDPVFYLKIAATLLLFFTVGWIVFQWSSEPVINAPVTMVNKTELITKATAKGQKYTLFLEDGTRVKLNSESQLQFASKFSDTARVVYLNGEAYFEVQEDPERPFTVISGDITTTALGTSFNILAPVGEEHIKVSLVSGKVRVDKTTSTEDSEPELILTPGIQAVYISDKNTLVTQPFEARKQLAWKDGILYFEDASWTQIVKKLESWYGVEVVVKNTVQSSQKPYTGTFTDQSLENVLESLSFTKGFSYRIDAPKVYVEFK